MQFDIGDFVLLYNTIHTRITEADTDAAGNAIYQTEDSGFEWIDEDNLSADPQPVKESDFDFDSRPLYAVLFSDSQTNDHTCKLFTDYSVASEYVRKRYLEIVEDELLLGHNVRTEFLPIQSLSLMRSHQHVVACIRYQYSEFDPWETISLQIVEPEIVQK